jgi:hypothetical protein
MSADKHKTLQIQLKKDNEANKIFKFMTGISKNVYNTVIYVYTIYTRYKSEIYKHLEARIDSGKIKNTTDIHSCILDKLEYFYNLHSKEDSVINENHNKIYKELIDLLDDDYLTNYNFDRIKKKIMRKKKKFTYSNKYEFEFIINHIMKNMYMKNYAKTVYQMKNKIPFTINDEEFLENVKNKECLFDTNLPDPKNSDKIKEIGKVQADKNIIKKFLYENLGENRYKLPADIIGNIINKAFNNLYLFSPKFSYKNFLIMFLSA